MNNTVVPKTHPEANPEANLEATPEANPEANQEATQEANPEATPEATPESPYEQKKNLAEGVLDFTLFIANVTQLVATLNVTNPNKYYIPMLIFLSLSFVLQVTVGILLILIGYHKFKTQENKDKTNNAATIIVFIITVINVFVLAFGVQLFQNKAV